MEAAGHDDQEPGTALRVSRGSTLPRQNPTSPGGDPGDRGVRDHRAARNFAILRKVAINLVSRDRSAKASMRARRKKAAWNDSYMRQLLVG